MFTAIKQSLVQVKDQPPVWLSIRSSVWFIAVVILIAFFTVCTSGPAECSIPASRAH